MVGYVWLLRGRVELTTLRIGDWLATYCANKADGTHRCLLSFVAQASWYQEVNNASVDNGSSITTNTPNSCKYTLKYQTQYNIFAQIAIPGSFRDKVNHDIICYTISLLSCTEIIWWNTMIVNTLWSCIEIKFDGKLYDMTTISAYARSRIK